MRRAAVLIALLALAVPAAAQAQAPALRAKVTSCTTGPESADRVAVFTGSMPSIPGTRRMGMRFELQARNARGIYVAVKATGLHIWQKSTPGRSAGFVFAQRVQSLAAPGSYRVVVRFRWYGKGGKVLRSAVKETGSCQQPDPRPDLVDGGVTAAAAPTPGQAIYSVVVRDASHAPAGPFDVAFSVTGADQAIQRVTDGLLAGQSATLTFAAQRCAPDSSVRFTIDARGEVGESDDADNFVTAPCPFAS
jgi:hypothetical protein